MAVEVPKRKCLTVLLLWRNLVGYPKKASSCSVNGSASRVMTSTSGTPLAVGCLLIKSTLRLVLIVTYHPIQIQRYLWISTHLTFIYSSDPKPARGQPKQSPEQEESNALPSPEEILVTLRLTVDSCGLSYRTALIQILLGGTPIRCRNHHLWIHAVRGVHVHIRPADTEVSGWLTFYSAFHSLVWCTSWTWSCRRWYRCNPPASLEGDASHHLIVSLSTLQAGSGTWGTPSMSPSFTGHGRA